MKNIVEVNKDRFIELMKKKNEFKRIENPVEAEEFSLYREMLEDQLVYNQCSDYVVLLQNYLNRKISLTDFLGGFYEYDDKYLKLERKLETDLEALRLFPMDSKSDGFMDIILEIYYAIDRLDERQGFTNRDGSWKVSLETDPKVEEAFRIDMQYCYEAIQKNYL